MRNILWGGFVLLLVACAAGAGESPAGHEPKKMVDNQAVSDLIAGYSTALRENRVEAYQRLIFPAVCTLYQSKKITVVGREVDFIPYLFSLERAAYGRLKDEPIRQAEKEPESILYYFTGIEEREKISSLEKYFDFGTAEGVYGEDVKRIQLLHFFVRERPNNVVILPVVCSKQGLYLAFSIHLFELEQAKYRK